MFFAPLFSYTYRLLFCNSFPLTFIRKTPGVGAISRNSIFGVKGIGERFPGHGFQFAADGVGGKAGAEQGAVERGDFLLVDGAAEKFEFALDALTDGGLLGVVAGGFGDGDFDVAVRNAAGAEVSGDAKFALPANLGPLARELFGVARVVDQIVFFQAGQNHLRQKFAGGATLKEFVHFVYRMRPPHQRPQCNIVKFGFSVELARLGEHQRSIEEEVASG
jgi:hypothetical protein